MQVHRLDIIHVFPVGVAGSAHKAQQVSRLDNVPLPQVRGKGRVLFQMGIIIVAAAVKGADANSPAPVPVPAHGLHQAALHRHHRRSQSAHQVISQMLAPKAEGTSRSEIVIVTVAIACGNGRKGLQAVGGNPLSVLFDGIAAHQTAQNPFVGPVVIVIVAIIASQQFLRGLVPLQIGNRLFHRRQAAFSPGAASRQSQAVDPGNVLFLLRRQNVLAQGVFQGFIGHVKIHPADGLPRRRNRHGKNQQNRRKKPPHILTSRLRI